MSEFIHTAEGKINIIDINGNRSEYDATWWIATQETGYALPTSAISQFYIPTQKRSWKLSGTDEIAVVGTIPWTNGDTYISKKTIYDAAWLAYSLTLSQAKVYQISLLTGYADIIRNAGITISGIIYQSSHVYYDRWKNEHDYAIRNAALLGSYYITDIVDNPISIASVVQLTGIIDDIDEFFWILQQNYDAHVTAINLLGTVSAVLAYDYTTGWPITPYNEFLTLYASYAASINADFSGGTSTGTATGGAAIAGGYLDLAHSDARYVDYSATSNADSQQIGYAVFTVKPNYSATPVADKVYMCIAKADADSTNQIQLTHKATSGNLQLDIRDSSDVSIASINLGVWAPTTGTDYKIAVYWDISTGNNFVLINDVQFGTTDTSTGTRSAAIGLLRIGSGYNSASAELSNFKIKLLHVSSQ